MSLGGATVILDYALVKGKGAVGLGDMEILEKCQAAQEKEEAKGAEKDW